MKVNQQAENKFSSFTLLFLLITVFLLLLATGLASLYSASYDKAMRLGLQGDYFFRRQFLFSLAGTAAAFVIFSLPVRLIRLLIPLLLVGSMILMLLTLFTSLGETQLGARRWITIGSFGFQPSELVKVSSILFLANYFDKHQDQLRQFSYTVYPAAVVGAFALMIFMQRDFSTTVIFLIVCFSLFAASGTKLSYLAYLAALVGIPGILLLFTEAYRVRRLIGFLFKDFDPSGINYQVNASLMAIRSGGLMGKGWGNGEYKFGLLPEVQSDFVFASFVEETGFIGGLFVLLLFGIIAVTGFYGAARLRDHDRFLHFLGIGVTSLIVFQAYMNIGVVIGVFPPTGIPLPFFSQGLTSLIVNLGMVGLLGKVLASSGKYRNPIADKSPDSNLDFQEVLYE
jgi:cell division protein FtsW